MQIVTNATAIFRHPSPRIPKTAANTNAQHVNTTNTTQAKQPMYRGTATEAKIKDNKTTAQRHKSSSKPDGPESWNATFRDHFQKQRYFFLQFCVW